MEHPASVMPEYEGGAPSGRLGCCCGAAGLVPIVGRQVLVKWAGLGCGYGGVKWHMSNGRGMMSQWFGANISGTVFT